MIYKQEPEDGNEQDLESLFKARRWMLRQAREAAGRGDPLAGMLSEIERAASPFFLGIDYSEDDEDLDLDIF